MPFQQGDLLGSVARTNIFYTSFTTSNCLLIFGAFIFYVRDVIGRFCVGNIICALLIKKLKTDLKLFRQFMPPQRENYALFLRMFPYSAIYA